MYLTRQFGKWIGLSLLFVSVTQILTGAESNHSLFQKSKAIQFGINSDFYFTKFNGGNFSFKYHVKDKWAVRAVLSLDYQNENSNDFSEHNMDPNETDRKQKYYHNGLIITGLLLYYPNPDDLSVYFGTGPYLTYANYGHNNYENDAAYSNQDNTGYGLGLSSVCGAEMFIKHNLSVHVEYQFDISYRYSQNKMKMESPEGSDYKRTIDSYQLGGSYLIVGMSVYF
jgi:hypothetical protein